MKKKIIFLVVISSFLGMFSLINFKQGMFCRSLSLTEIEALASEGKTYLIKDCIMGAEHDQYGDYWQTSCNEVDYQQPDEMNECEEVLTEIRNSTDKGMCYQIIWEPIGS
jgi:hypothetical protein